MNAVSHVKSIDLKVTLFKILSFANSFYFKLMSCYSILYGFEALTQRKSTSFWNQVVCSIFKPQGEAVAFACRLAICKSRVLERNPENVGHY